MSRTADVSTKPLRLAVFASGGGTNFQAILDAVEAGALPLTVALCVSNRADAVALDRARHHDVPTVVLDPADFPTEEAYCQVLLDALRQHKVNFIALAGYMKKIPSKVVRAYRNRMINVHPALLPSFGGHGFYGKKVHQAVLDYGAQWTGATVHLVDEEYDTGPIVLQKPVPVHPDDTAEILAARVLETEHTLYPEALRLFAEGRVAVSGRKVRLEREERGETRAQRLSEGKREERRERREGKEERGEKEGRGEAEAATGPGEGRPRWL